MKKSTKKTSKTGLLPLCLAFIPLLAATLFFMPQFSRTILGSALKVNGFRLAFGFNDIVKVPGKGYVFISFLLSVLSAAMLSAASFTKVPQSRLRIIYIVTAVSALTCAILLIVAVATIKDINYYKAILDVTKNGSFTAWIYIGIVLHFLTVIGCAVGFFKARQ